MNPTARSPAERQLDRIHSDEDEPISAEVVTAERIETERALAMLIADHPSISMAVGDVLELCEYDLQELRTSASELYPDYATAT